MKLFNINTLLFIGIFSLAGCGGDESGPNLSGTATSGPNSVTVSSPTVNVSLLKGLSDSYSPHVMTLTVSFQAEGFIAGYAPGVTPPDWLYVSIDPDTPVGEEFNLYLVFYMPAGGVTQSSTSLRLVAGNLDGTNVAILDVPITLKVKTIPDIYTDGLTIDRLTTDSAGSADQVMQLDFSGLSNYSWTASLENYNHSNNEWLGINSIFANDQLDVDTTISLPVGQYLGNIAIDIDDNGSAAQWNIPVTYNVTAGEPEIHNLIPAVGYVDTAGTVLIRGAGFTTQAIQEVRIDDVSRTFTVSSDTEISVDYPAISIAGDKQVQLVTAGSTYISDQNFIIKEPLPFVAADFDLVGSFSQMRFDVTRDVLLVSTASNLYRLKIVGGVWSIVTQRAIGIGQFDLSPDSKYIVNADVNGINLFDAVTLADVTSYPDIPATFARLEHVASNGEVFFESSRSDNFETFNLINKTRTVSPVTLESNMTRTSHDRDRIYFSPNSNVPNFGGYYDASSNEYIELTTYESYYTNRFSFSGDGSRLLTNNDSLYDASHNLLGNLEDDASISNYTLELSADGNTGYKVAAGSGWMYPYDLTVVSPYPLLARGRYAVPIFSFYAAFPDTLVSDDGRLMFLGGGKINSSTTGKRLVIVPLD